MNFVLSSYSYSTGYQGAKAQYAGIYYNKKKYSNTTYGRFDTTLQFDPDDPEYGMPDLHGEMTSVFIPEESLSNMPDWVSLDWVREASYISNPQATYEWESDDRIYTMEAWLLRWYFSISADWSGHAVWEGVLGEGEREEDNKRYDNTEIWFEIDLTPTWYFEPVPADTLYFAIAKMEIADVRLHALNNENVEVSPSLETSVVPDSQGSSLPLYYGLFAKQNPADKEVYTYQGKKLNPDLFTSKVYTYFTLANFGTTAWPEFGWSWESGFFVQKAQGDVVTVAVDVTVFVVGEWDVKDIESIEEIEGEEGYGRTAQVGVGGYSFGDWLSSPANRLLLALIVGLAVFLIIAIAFPGVIMILLMFIQSITGGRRRR